ncbi:MAG: 16S rRNA (cytosine(1402)-N(4))-methyltransferase RsmH [Planctomycetes bacterium]|nr:16S rRNA (cytosine(1402)-N(4))-methyltransferase RsmH [Planctomycetota bacterium]
MDAPPNEPETPASGHVPVLPNEVLAWLDPGPGDIVLDCTLGRAGHAALIAPRLSPDGRYIGLDVDPANIAHARTVLKNAPVKIDLVKSNFAAARSVLDSLGIDRVDLVLADLGFASNQMSDPARGFSFMSDGPLDMRLDPELGVTAADLVAALSEADLADVIYRFGEERLSRKIARKIVEERERTPILTTTDLARVVREACGVRSGASGGRGAVGGGGWARRGASRLDPATKTFMALRIAVNEELGALERLLGALPALMAGGGRAAVISFHSLEDRRVKRAFADMEQSGAGKRLTRRPVTATENELRSNPRSRSAKLRVFEWA